MFMNFHETKMGRIFYEGTAPRIAKALEVIAKRLDAPATTAVLPGACEVPADFLAELYQGSYDPSDEPDSEDVARYTTEILAEENALRAAVSPGTWKQFDLILSLVNKRGDRQREQAFAAGFRSAMMMVMAGLTRPDSGKVA